MVNEHEAVIQERYEARGWTTLRGGAPDFVFLKFDIEGNIEKVRFVEVKLRHHKSNYPDFPFKPKQQFSLTQNQRLYKRVLESLGADCRVERVDNEERTRVACNKTIKLGVRE